MSDTLVEESILGVEVELPDGDVVTCRALTVSDFVRFRRLMLRSSAGDDEAFVEFLTEFPAAIGQPSLVDRLTPGEVVALVGRFFTLARPFPGAMPSGGTATTEPNGASTTSGPTTPTPTAPPPNPATPGTPSMP